MSIIVINVAQARATWLDAQTPEDAAGALGLPVIAEITPQPDPVYGHTFVWPEQEIEQFLAQEASRGH